MVSLGPFIPAHYDAYSYFRGYMSYQQIRNFSPATIRQQQYNLKHYVEWLDSRGIDDLRHVSFPIIESYQRYLYYYKSEKTNKPLAIQSQVLLLSAVKSFYGWMVRQKHIAFNPASELEMPKQGKRLPRKVLSTEEVYKLMDTANPNDLPFGLRTRAILELLYATGIRRSELKNLILSDIGRSEMRLLIRYGKGQKDRYTPLTPRCLHWLEEYINTSRKMLDIGVTNTVFLNRYGKGLSVGMISSLVPEL